MTEQEAPNQVVDVLAIPTGMGLKYTSQGMSRCGCGFTRSFVNLPVVATDQVKVHPQTGQVFRRFIMQDYRCPRCGADTINIRDDDMPYCIANWPTPGEPVE